MLFWLNKEFTRRFLSCFVSFFSREDVLNISFCFLKTPGLCLWLIISGNAHIFLEVHEFLFDAFFSFLVGLFLLKEISSKEDFSLFFNWEQRHEGFFADAQDMHLVDCFVSPMGLILELRKHRVESDDVSCLQAFLVAEALLQDFFGRSDFAVGPLVDELLRKPKRSSHFPVFQNVNVLDFLFLLDENLVRLEVLAVQTRAKVP